MPQPIAENILEILNRGSLEGSTYRLPDEPLDRKSYDACAKVLADNGAKWDKKTLTHVFGSAGSPDRFRKCLEAGRSSAIQQEAQFFATPAALVQQLIEAVQLGELMSLLEPSAGQGAIAVHAARLLRSGEQIQTCETYTPFQDHLEGFGFACWRQDFLTVDPDTAPKFDRVAMNPPFTRGADVKHVTHALRFLKPGGVLASIMSNGWRQNSDAASVAFRELVESSGATVTDVPAGAFRESGTAIATCIVVFGGEE